MSENAAAEAAKVLGDSEIDVMRFISYRRQEIDLLMSDSFLAKPKSKVNKSMFQLLPRHMRRRTMGFIRKRLPHRIRQASVIKTPTTKASKRPSRKYRRKPSNMISEYERRKRASFGRMWLETHIWHAKRFKMSDSLYGYRLALFDNCKSQRPAYRCLKSACCIHDESYSVCHELIGTQEDLINGLSRLCSTNLGLTFAAKMFLDGRYEGRLVLYEADKYPYECMGPCRFLWKPVTKGESVSERTLWIWTHPSIYMQLQNELIKIWDMNKKSETNQSDDPPKSKKMKLSDSANASSESVPTNSTMIVKFKSSSGRVELECLKDELVRFKLLGPLSTQILANVLWSIDAAKMNETELKIYESQIQIWEKIKSSVRNPSELTDSAVVGLLVKDPRLVLPKKKSFKQIEKQNNRIDSRKSQASLQEINQQLRESILSRSQIWEKNIIESLNASKKTTREINKMREEYFMPGTRLTKLENHSKVPVLLIQNASSNGARNVNGGHMLSGWDLVLPKSWAMPFWMCCIHFGARAIGQNELNYLYFESGNLQFPNEFIDTNSSRIELDKLKVDLYAQHKRRPASKRINFLKRQYLTPFYAPYRSLLSLSQGRSDELGNYFILRDKKLLRKLQLAMFSRNNPTKSTLESLNQQELDLIRDSYVPVRLECDGRGTLDRFSLIFKRKPDETKTSESKNESESRLSLARIISEHRSQTVKKLIEDEKSKDSKKRTPTGSILNKLIRSKYDSSELLVDEKAFLKFQNHLIESKQTPIGFVLNGGFNLACGKYAANGFVLTRILLESVTDGRLVSFRSPKNCSEEGFKTARITHIFDY